jgi:hypothetical protein
VKWCQIGRDCGRAKRLLRFSLKHRWTCRRSAAQSRRDKERGPLLRRRPPIEVDAIGRGDRRDDAGRCVDLHALEELDGVIDDILERGGAVVVEVRRRLADPAQSGYVELVPVVRGWRAADEPGQQRAAGIGGRTADRRAVGPGDVVSPATGANSLDRPIRSDICFPGLELRLVSL